jgi:hypothetical protein
MGDLDEFRGSRGVGHAAKSRPPSARALRDAVLMPILLALWTANWLGSHGGPLRWRWRSSPAPTRRLKKKDLPIGTFYPSVTW